MFSKFCFEDKFFKLFLYISTFYQHIFENQFDNN